MRRKPMIFFAIFLLALAGAAAWLYTPDRDRATLERIYAGPPSQFVDLAGVRLHLRDTGGRDAPAIILLHGFGSSLHTWDEWAAALEGQYRVIRFDLPGFGLTGRDPTGNYTDERSVAVVLALMDRLGLARATLVGNSMGGRIAWRFAAAHPDRMTKLVLLAPDGFASEGIDYNKAPTVPLTMKILPYVLPTPLLKATLAPAYANKAVMTDALVVRYRDMMLAPGVRQAILDRMPQTILLPPAPLLHQIKMPVLLLWGEQDGMVPFSNAADYQRELPQAKLVALPGVGHLPMEEAVGPSLAALRAFLAE